MAHGNREKFEGSGVKPHLVARWAEPLGTNAEWNNRGASSWSRTPSGQEGRSPWARTPSGIIEALAPGPERRVEKKGVSPWARTPSGKIEALAPGPERRVEKMEPPT